MELVRFIMLKFLVEKKGMNDFQGIFLWQALYASAAILITFLKNLE